MELFNRNNPAYKRGRLSQVVAATQPAAPTGLSGLIGSLFGSATPAYKTVGGRDAKAPAPSTGLMSMFAAAPSYKTAQMAEVVQQAPLEVVQQAALEVDGETCEPVLDDEGVPCVGATDEIVLL
jgi:hypothetical protein